MLTAINRDSGADRHRVSREDLAQEALAKKLMLTV